MDERLCLSACMCVRESEKETERERESARRRMMIELCAFLCMHIGSEREVGLEGGGCDR